MFTQISGEPTFFRGSLKSYPLDILYEEISFLAYYFHWPYTEIMNLNHKERMRFCNEVSRINKKMNEEQSGEDKKRNVFEV